MFICIDDIVLCVGIAIKYKKKIGHRFYYMLSFNQRKLSTCKYVVTMPDCILLSLLISNMLPKCINLRQIIFKISVKICTEIYSPSRGEDYYGGLTLGHNIGLLWGPNLRTQTEGYNISLLWGPNLRTQY